MTTLDPSTRFSVAQIERAMQELCKAHGYHIIWDEFETYLERQRGQYQHRRPGSNPGGYPKGRPRKSTREEE